jgi:fibronectin-binding autotransporter adhesin
MRLFSAQSVFDRRLASVVFGIVVVALAIPSQAGTFVWSDGEPEGGTGWNDFWQTGTALVNLQVEPIYSNNWGLSAINTAPPTPGLGDNAIISAPYLATLSGSSGTVDSLTLGGTLNVANGSLFMAGPSLTDNGLLSPGSGGNLQLIGNVATSGSGVIAEAGGAIGSPGGFVLTIGASNTINGYGSLSAAMVNNGLVNANNAAGFSLSVLANVSNDTTMEATGGGVLSIGAATVSNFGTILASGGNVQVNGGMLVGGMLTSTGTSSISAVGGASLSGVTLTNGSVLNIPAGQTVTVSNGITNNGTIFVNSNSAGIVASLTFSGSQTLSGSGSVVLNYISTYAQLNTSNSGVLTQAAGHTISGYGEINAALINQGTVNANVSGQTLILQTNAMANTGLMEATSGGLLNVTTNIDNTGGLILAGGTGNSVTINSGATITGGTLTSLGPASFLANGPATLNNVTISAGSQYNSPAGNSTTVTGGLTNNGTIIVNSNAGGNVASLTFSGSQTLAGSGSVVLNYLSSYAQLNTSNSGVLTQAAGHTISGYGEINAALINQGTVNANVNGQTLFLLTNSMANSGTMEATSGGLLNIETAVNNAGATILASGGNVQITGSSIAGGTLTSAGSSSFAAFSGAALNGVTISNSSVFDIPSGQAVTVSNGLTNNGTIIVNSNAGGNVASLTFSGSQMLAGSGSVVLNYFSSYAQLNTSNSGVLTQAAGHTISGYGEINAALINQGTVNANVSGQTLFLLTNSMANSGTMEATSGGLLNIETAVNDSGGTILASGGNVQITGGSIAGGTLTSAGSSSFAAFSGAALNGVTISNSSVLDIPSGQAVTVSNGLTNNGTIIVNSNAAGNVASLTFSGSQTLSGSGSVILNYVSSYTQLNTSNSGVLTQAAGHTISGFGGINAALINQGLVNANVSGQTLFLETNAMANTGTMEATSGGLLNVTTNINNTGGLILAGGTGNTVTINNSAIITGGTLTSLGPASFLANGLATLNSVTISASSQFNISAGITTTATGGLTNNGTITVNVNQNSPSFLTFNGSQTLSGSGTIALTADGNNPSYAQINTSSGTLTQAAGQTILGWGAINAALINQGTIDANNASGWTLSLQGSAESNSGLMEATNGGLLSISTTVNNAGSTILAAGGNVQIAGGTVIGGRLTSTGSSNFSASGAPVLSGVTLTSSSVFDIPANLTATITNGLVNNGAITVNLSQNSPSFLTFNGSQTLSGSGTIALTADGNNPTYAQINTSSGTLTQAAGSTILGWGAINAALINQGTIDANNANGWTLSLQGSAQSNSGLLEATSGGLLSISTTINNAGGTILASGGNVQIAGGTIVGGVLTSTGSSNFSASGAILSGVTLSSSTVLNIPANQTVTVTNGLVNNGAITVNLSQNSPSFLTFNGSQTLSGSGTIALTADGNNPTYAQLTTASGTLTQASGHTIGGWGEINAALVNQGTIDANNNSGNTLAITGTLDNQGTVEAMNGGVASISADVIQVSGSTLTGGTWIAQANSTVSITSAGTLSTNQGTVILNGLGSSFPNINPLAVNQGSFTVAGGRAFSTSGALTNSGTITIGGGSVLTVKGQYFPAVGSTTLVNGLLSLTGTTTLEGILTGTGTASGSLATGGSGSTVVPGGTTTIGTLSTGALNLSAGGNLNYLLGTAGTSALSPGLGSLINVAGNLMLPSSQIANLNLVNNNNANGQGSLGNGFYDLFNYSGTLVGSPAAAFGVGSGNKTWSFTTVAGSPNELILLISTLSLNWTGVSGGTGAADSGWNLTSTNWSNNATNSAQAYFDGAKVSFGDMNAVSGGPILNPNVTLNSVFAPASITFSNSAVNYTISGSGSIAGPTGITMNGTGVVSLQTANSFSGPVTIDAGAINIANSGALGNSSGVTVAGGGALQFQGGFAANGVGLFLNGAGLAANPAGALDNVAGSNIYGGAITLESPAAIDSTSGTLMLTGGIVNGGNLLTVGGTGATLLSGNLSGSGGLTLSGAGLLILSGSDNYSGDTTVTQGTLVLASTTAIAPGTSLVVGAGATLLFEPAEVASLVQPALSAAVASPVPEPGAVALLIAGLAAAFAVYRPGLRNIPRS